MKNYNSVQEVVDLLTSKEIYTILKEAGEKCHHAEAHESLAEKLINLQNRGNTKEQVEEKATSSNKELEEWAKKIREESDSVKKAVKKDRVMNFISKDFNARVSCIGQNKEGKNIRYAEGYDTIDIEEQRRTGDVFKSDYILFRGIEGTEYVMDKFIGRGWLSTSSKGLQDYLFNHKRYGSKFILYDKEEISRREAAHDEKITKLKSWMYNASRDDLLSILVYIEMSTGRNPYEKLSNITDMNILTASCRKIIEKDPDAFLAAMESKRRSLIHLVHKAKDMGVIKVTKDEREVKLAENGRTLVKSSVSSNWQDDIVNYLTQPDGLMLIKKLELKTNYYVI